MNPIKSSVFQKITQRDGLLMLQLYQLLPLENRVSYSTLRRWIAEEATINKISRTKFEQLSNCIYLTTSRKLSTKRKRLMVLVTQWEIHTGKKAIWYRPSTELHLIYLLMAKYLKPTSDTIDDIEKANYRKRYLLKSHDWMKKSMEEKVERAEYQRLKRLGKEKSKEDSHDLRRVDIKEHEYFKTPNPSLYSLWSRGIMPYFIHSKIDKKIESIGWLFFDIDKDLPIERFSDGMRAIFDFTILHNLQDIPFMVGVYTWNERKKILYEKTHKFTLNRLIIKEKYPRERERLWRKGTFKGVKFVNLNIDKYLNQIRTPKTNS